MKRTIQLRGAIAAVANSRRFAGFLCAAIVLVVCHPATAAIIAGSGTGTMTFDASAGGGPVIPFTAAIPEFPGLMTLDVPLVGASFGFMADSWSKSMVFPDPAPFDVFLAHDQRKGSHPSGDPFLFTLVGSTFTTTLDATFTVSYTLDGGGLGATLLPPITYPVEVISSSGAVTFDASIGYSSAALGPLGTRALSFHPPAGFSTPGFIPVTGSGPLLLPPLPPGDTLTLTGAFGLSVNALGGTSTEIKIFGVPEPSTAVLLACGGALLFAGALRRVGKRR
jgi:hypothetical protein